MFFLVVDVHLEMAKPKGDLAGTIVRCLVRVVAFVPTKSLLLDMERSLLCLPKGVRFVEEGVDINMDPP